MCFEQLYQMYFVKLTEAMDNPDCQKYPHFLLAVNTSQFNLNRKLFSSNKIKWFFHPLLSCPGSMLFTIFHCLWPPDSGADEVFSPIFRILPLLEYFRISIQELDNMAATTIISHSRSPREDVSSIGCNGE